MEKPVEMKGNIGEWSELYTFMKLLASGRIYAADDNACKIDSIYYPIKKVIREESSGNPIEYFVGENSVDIEIDGKCVKSADRTEMSDKADELFKRLRCYANGLSRSTKGSFEIKKTNDYANGIRVTKLKAPSNVTSDILMQLHDIYTSFDRIVGFSIKSEIGSAPTLVNASKATNFRYEITGLSEEDVDKVNTINTRNTRNKIKDRIMEIKNLGGDLSFVKPVNDKFTRNLKMEDGDMARIIAEALLIHYEENLKDCKAVITRLGEKDPLEYGEDIMYEAKFKRFLCDSALGMKPTTKWDGENEANGGYIIVKADGDVLAYTLYDMDAFKRYLYTGTKFDRASTSRHEFATPFIENNRIYIDLNLQIRFL